MKNLFCKKRTPSKNSQRRPHSLLRKVSLVGKLSAASPFWTSAGALVRWVGPRRTTAVTSRIRSSSSLHIFIFLSVLKFQTLGGSIAQKHRPILGERISGVEVNPPTYRPGKLSNMFANLTAQAKETVVPVSEAGLRVSPVLPPEPARLQFC